MKTRFYEGRAAWLLGGVLLGMVVAYYCPAEPAYASTASQGERFAMITTPTLAGNSEAVFVLDMITGRLIGAAYNTQTNSFSHQFARNLAVDFRTTDRSQYVMVAGEVNLQSTAGGPAARGGIYVGELNSGIVALYGFPYIQSPRGSSFELVPIAQFPWRQATN